MESEENCKRLFNYREQTEGGRRGSGCKDGITR